MNRMRYQKTMYRKSSMQLLCIHVAKAIGVASLSQNSQPGLSQNGRAVLQNFLASDWSSELEPKQPTRLEPKWPNLQNLLASAFLMHVITTHQLLMFGNEQRRRVLQVLLGINGLLVRDGTLLRLHRHHVVVTWHFQDVRIARGALDQHFS